VEVLKVSSKSNPNSCAGALAGVLRQSGAVEVQVVGAGALNQAIKAVAIARGFVADSGLDLVCVPTFADIEIDGESRTAIRLLVEDRSRRQPVTLDMRLEPATVVNGSARLAGNGHLDGVPLDGGAFDGATLGGAALDGAVLPPRS
jgi:stage V sporulation protein S